MAVPGYVQAETFVAEQPTGATARLLLSSVDRSAGGGRRQPHGGLLSVAGTKWPRPRVATTKVRTEMAVGGQDLGRGNGDRLIADRAYEELRDRIVTLKLPPGTVLREDELMAQLAIGRTPLRDAIKRLALEGLVAVQPRRGTTITPVDSSD